MVVALCGFLSCGCSVEIANCWLISGGFLVEVAQWRLLTVSCSVKVP